MHVSLIPFGLLSRIFVPEPEGHWRLFVLIYSFIFFVSGYVCQIKLAIFSFSVQVKLVYPDYLIVLCLLMSFISRIP